MRSVFFTCVFLLLAACSGSGEPIPNDDAGGGSILTGRSEGGVTLSDLGRLMGTDSGGLPINALLWRASLDIASSIPIDDIDTYGGSIVTEWYSLASSANERIKLTFFVLDLELRSDAIRVHAYVQKRQNDLWIDNGTDPDLARKLEDLVLTRAREIRASGITESGN